jgi:hypothetical protein
MFFFSGFSEFGNLNDTSVISLMSTNVFYSPSYINSHTLPPPPPPPPKQICEDQNERFGSLGNRITRQRKFEFNFEAKQLNIFFFSVTRTDF